MKEMRSVATNFLVIWIGIIFLFEGCVEKKGENKEREKMLKPAIMTARYTEIPVEIDGVLDDKAWETAEVYNMRLGKDMEKEGKKLEEGGEVKLSWDNNNFYVGIRFYDSDIVAEGKEDQLHHYSLGDLVEVFLKPEGETWYWELYATPANKKSSFWFPGRGRILPSCFTDYRCGLKVAAQCDGTLNNWEDRDRFWTAEMAMPIKDITARGETFTPESKWRILVARYNYSRYLPNPELSMTPQLSQTNYHRYEEYGILELKRYEEN